MAFYDDVVREWESLDGDARRAEAIPYLLERAIDFRKHVAAAGLPHFKARRRGFDGDVLHVEPDAPPGYTDLDQYVEDAFAGFCFSHGFSVELRRFFALSARLERWASFETNNKFTEPEVVIQADIGSFVDVLRGRRLTTFRFGPTTTVVERERGCSDAVRAARESRDEVLHERARIERSMLGRPPEEIEAAVRRMEREGPRAPRGHWDNPPPTVDECERESTLISEIKLEIKETLAEGRRVIPNDLAHRVHEGHHCSSDVCRHSARRDSRNKCKGDRSPTAIRKFIESDARVQLLLMAAAKRCPAE